ncbi:MAG: FG-GAP repeat protein [Planctomycetes bacterium]|nr:FG-GAP repeat protein [Planctomycetota bacterium]
MILPFLYSILLCCAPIPQSTEGRFELLYTLDGKYSKGRFGFSVSSAGDFDGDGHPDILIGTPNEVSDSAHKGAAYVYSGQNGKQLHRWVGGSRTFFGKFVTAVGDVNADGIDDVAMVDRRSKSRNDDEPLRGSVTVFSGRNGRPILGLLPECNFHFYSTPIAAAGDVNNDGHADLFITTPTGAERPRQYGSAYLISGKDGSKIHQWNGTRNRKLGFMIANLGDVNGDAVVDVALRMTPSFPAPPGVWREPEFEKSVPPIQIQSGKDGSLLYLCECPKRLIEATTDEPLFGWQVVNIGDVNDDHCTDFLTTFIGDRGSSNALVFSGKDGSELFHWPLTANPGLRIVTTPDLNGDSFNEVLIHAIEQSASGENEQAVVKLCSVQNGTVIQKITSPTPDTSFGYSMAFLGDINGNGNQEVAIGAFLSDRGDKKEAGAVYVYSWISD